MITIKRYVTYGKQEKFIHEVILQIGDKDNMRSETMKRRLQRCTIEYMKGFQERNPTLRVFAHLHFDEASTTTYILILFPMLQEVSKLY